MSITTALSREEQHKIVCDLIKNHTYGSIANFDGIRRTAFQQDNPLLWLASDEFVHDESLGNEGSRRYLQGKALEELNA